MTTVNCGGTAYRLVFENLQRAGVTLLPQQTLWKRLIDR